MFLICSEISVCVGGQMSGKRHYQDRQLSLDLALPQPEVLFFAVIPPSAIAAHIAERAEKWQRRHRVRARLRPPGLLHVSMNMVGIYSGPSNAVVRAAMEAGSRVEIAPFDVTFDLAMGFKNKVRSPFVLCAQDDLSGLSDLRSAIGATMRNVGFPDSNRASFKPHVTMMYTDDMMSAASVDEPIRWTVRDFVLVRSLHGRGRHVHCQRWPLHG
jgi:RNA 2',3'-cyclic 3'-phosphodiesterase